MFEYVKEAFSSEDERILERGVKAIASENPVCYVNKHTCSTCFCTD